MDIQHPKICNTFIIGILSFITPHVLLECQSPPLRKLYGFGFIDKLKSIFSGNVFHGGCRYKAVKSAYHRSFNEIQVVKVELESLQQEVTNFQSLYQIIISKLHITHIKYIMQKSCR